MVGKIERGMMAGTRQLSERRSYNTPGLAKPLLDAASAAIEAKRKYDNREKALVFKRLDLEAANLQAEQMENIRTATSVDQIPGMVEDFEKRIADNMKDQKWGQEWMDERSASFYTANHNDVAKAFRGKEKELAGIELNKTVSAYADNIALSGAAQAQTLMADAEGLIDADTYLTPAEKQKSKENLSRVAITGMVNHNPAEAIRQLKDPHRFNNLGEVDRKEYLERAEKMLKAKQADQYAQQQKAQAAAAKQADTDIRLADIGLMTGEITQEEAIKIAQENASKAPKTAQDFLKRVLGKDAVKDAGKVEDDPDLLQSFNNRILAGEDVRRDLIVAEADGQLTTKTINNLMKRGKELGNWNKNDNPDDDNLRKYIGRVSMLGQDGINKLYSDGEISNNVRVDLIRELNAKEKRQAKDEADEKKELQGKLKEVSDMLNSFKASTDAAAEEAKNNNYLDMSDKISGATSAADLPTIQDINDQVRSGDIDEKQAKVLRTARNKAETAFAKQKASQKKRTANKAKPEKLSAGEKSINLAELQDRYLVLRSNPEATTDQYMDLLHDLQDSVAGETVPSKEGQQLLSDIYIPLAEQLKADVQSQGVDHWFGADEGSYALQKFIDKNLPYAKADKLKTVGERSAAKEDNARVAKQRARLYQLYKDNLQAAAAKYDVDVSGIKDSVHKSEIYAAAVEGAKKQYLGSKYPDVDVARINPTRIMSSEGVETVASGAEDKGTGKPLVDNRIVQAGRAKDGRFAAKYADGTIKIISEDQYNAYMGAK